MVGYEGTKMSKSLGNLVFVRDLLKTWDPVAVRLAVLAHHYRSDWEWHDDLLQQAATRLASWREARQHPGHPSASLVDEVRAALDDDLDTPGAVATIDAALTSGGTGKSQADISEATGLLGVLL
jgi:L-cysteine:1D-myo-inositol 2-amino-2-deoxy-alpha-D-glucopyranoside ligase